MKTFIVVFVVTYLLLTSVKFEDQDQLLPIDVPQFESDGSYIWGFVPSQEDIHCLVLNIYFEARGETREGRYAVTDVVIQRVKSAYFPDDICSVVFFRNHRTCAFSWTCDQNSNDPVDQFSIREAVDIAHEVLYDVHYEPTVPMSTHYHAVTVEPDWVFNKHFHAQIGNHFFYQR